MKKTGDLDLKLNIIIGMLNQVFIIIINLISKNVIQKALGIEYMGIQTVFSNICDILTFAFAGIGVGVLYSFYRPIEEKNVIKIRQIYMYYKKIYRIMTAVSFLFGCVALFAVPFIIDVDISVVRLVVYYLIYMCSVVVYNRYLLYQYMLIAFQKRYVICLISAVIETMILLVQIGLLQQTNRYELFLMCILIKNIAINYFVRKYLAGISPYIFKKDTLEVLAENERGNILRNLKDLIISRVGSVLIHSTDSILISGLISTKLSGCYSNYYFVFMGVLGIGTSFFESIMSKIGSLSVKMSKEDLFSNFWKVSMVTLWLNGFCVTCYYALIQDFIYLWIGNESILSNKILFIIILNLYVEGMKLVGATYRKAVGLFDQFEKVIILRGILNLLLSVLLGKQFGLMGILIATFITNVITECWYVPYRLYKYFGKSLKYELLYQFLGITSVTACVAVTSICSSYINASTWGGFLIKAIVCGVVSNCVYLVLSLLYIRVKKNN